MIGDRETATQKVFAAAIGDAELSAQPAHIVQMIVIEPDYDFGWLGAPNVSATYGPPCILTLGTFRDSRFVPAGIFDLIRRNIV